MPPQHELKAITDLTDDDQIKEKPLALTNEEEPASYADNEEMEDMKKVHSGATAQMKEILDGLKSIRRKTVIDVGCGGCELSRDLLKDYFQEIHFLDDNEEAIAEAIHLRNEFDLKCRFLKFWMQSFDIDEVYDCVVMRYCIGYLKDEEAMKFLRRMKVRLSGPKNIQKRSTQRESYILVQDQIVPEEEQERVAKK